MSDDEATEPSFMDAVREMFRDAAQLLDELPDRIDRWLRSRHYPWDVAGDGTVAWCLVCKVEWPCDEFVRLDEQIAARSTPQPSE